MEIFKDVKGYEGLYQVSDLGNIKSLARGGKKERMLKLNKDREGYLHVSLSINNISKTIKIHKLVAIAFLGHIPCGYKEVVDHIDNNQSNNTVDNLQLTTVTHNRSKDIDKTKTTSKYTGVNKHKTSNKWEARIRINKKRKHLGYFINELDASNAYQLELGILNK